MKARQEDRKIQTSLSTLSQGNAGSKRILLVVGIIFVAAALRAPFTSVGPLLEMIRDDLGLSNTLAGAITTLPLLIFLRCCPHLLRSSPAVLALPTC